MEVVLEDFSITTPFDRGPQHALGHRRVQAFVQQLQEGLLAQFAGRRLLQAVADVCGQRHMREQLLTEKLLTQRVRAFDIAPAQHGQVQVGVGQIGKAQQRQRLGER